MIHFEMFNKPPEYFNVLLIFKQSSYYTSCRDFSVSMFNTIYGNISVISWCEILITYIKTKQRIISQDIIYVKL